MLSDSSKLDLQFTQATLLLHRSPFVFDVYISSVRHAAFHFIHNSSPVTHTMFLNSQVHLDTHMHTHTDRQTNSMCFIVIRQY